MANKEVKDAKEMLRETLEKKFKNTVVKPAHTGFAIMCGSKRACEVAMNKRTGKYSVACHFATAEAADLVNVQEIRTQQNNYSFKDLDKAEMLYVANELYKAKKSIVAKPKTRKEA